MSLKHFVVIFGCVMLAAYQVMPSSTDIEELKCQFVCQKIGFRFERLEYCLQVSLILSNSSEVNITHFRREPFSAQYKLACIHGCLQMMSCLEEYNGASKISFIAQVLCESSCKNDCKESFAAGHLRIRCDSGCSEQLDWYEKQEKLSLYEYPTNKTESSSGKKSKGEF